jgi:hypothetical protein
MLTVLFFAVYGLVWLVTFIVVVRHLAAIAPGPTDRTEEALVATLAFLVGSMWPLLWGGLAIGWCLSSVVRSLSRSA